MATMLFVTGTCFILMATILAHRLTARSVPWPERAAFSAVLIIAGVYMLTIGKLFWLDLLGPENYVASFWLVRTTLAAMSVYALWVLWHWPTIVRDEVVPPPAERGRAACAAVATLTVSVLLAAAAAGALS